jgi:hypothetical protein
MKGVLKTANPWFSTRNSFIVAVEDAQKEAPKCFRLSFRNKILKLI